MPLQKINFQTGFIYKIECRDPLVINKYWGSSCGQERYRRSCHKCCCTNPNDIRYNMQLYKFIREHGGWDNWVFIKIKDFPCANRNELNIEEQKYILADPTCLNTYKAHQTENEKLEQHKFHNNKNNPINNPTRSKIIIICDCGGSYNYINKSQHCKTKLHRAYLKGLEQVKPNETIL